MNHQLVLKQAILSEKVYAQMETGIYTFLVSDETTKNDIKKAVESQFSVKVRKINIGAKASKKTRITGTRKMVDRPSQKKAIVHLVAGQKITLLSPTTESKKEKKDKKEIKTTEQKTEKKSLISRITKSKKKEEVTK